MGNAPELSVLPGVVELITHAKRQTMNHLRESGRFRIGINCHKIIRPTLIRDDSGDVEELLRITRVVGLLQTSNTNEV